MMKAFATLRAVLGAVIVILATGCVNDEMIEKIDLADGKKITINVGMPADDAQTRIAFDGATKLTWEPGDQLTVSRGGESQSFVIGTISSNGKSASFSGILPIAGSGNYTVTYGNTTMNGQKQNATVALKHLKNYICLSKQVANFNVNFTLEMTSSIMKFVLTNLPATNDLGALKYLTWITGPGTAVNLDISDCTITSNTLTAYIAFNAPVTINSGNNFTALLVGDKNSYQFNKTLSADKTYTHTMQYTAQADSWLKMDAMSFTIRVTDTYKAFNIPFSGSGTAPAHHTVIWGDGTATVVAAGATLNDDDSFSNHAYSSNSDYVITVTSSQAASTQQIPDFNFYKNRSKGFANQLMLISMDTPLLNTGATDFTRCFYDCINLTSVDALFSKNVAAENFFICFGNCTSLTYVVPGLFYKNDKAKNFKSCFLNCPFIITVPVGLFDRNIAAENFESCFKNCTGITSLPAGLFVENVAVKDFSDCFNGCTGLTSLPAGLFAKNVAVEDFSYCFENCTELTSLPVGLFDENLAATNFSYCFNGCVKLVLNAEIFCSPVNLNRFSGKNMGFGNCFYNVGYRLSASQKAQSVAPELWKYTVSSSTPANCYTGCNASNNWASAGLPPYWGTPKP